MAGTSQIAASASESAAWLAGAPSICTSRRSRGPASRPVAIAKRPPGPSTMALSDQAAAGKPSSEPSRRSTSASLAPRRPRPGTRNEIASSRLVLPAPFAAGQHHGPRVDLEAQARVGAEPVQAELPDRQPPGCRAFG